MMVVQISLKLLCVCPQIKGGRALRRHNTVWELHDQFLPVYLKIVG